MPIHDWSRVDASLFQSFRSGWIVAVSDALNRALEKNGYYALLAPAALSVDEIVAPLGSVRFREPWLDVPPTDEMEFYRLRKSHVVVRRSASHDVVAVVDIASAGDKASADAVRTVARRISGVLARCVHFVFVDPLSTGLHDSAGVHAAVCAELGISSRLVRADGPLTAVSYDATQTHAPIIKSFAPGVCLPDLPVFLDAGRSVILPLEGTYQTEWGSFPDAMRPIVAGGEPA